MDWMTVVIVLHVMIALAIIGLVLLQHGKGADMGSGFGGGASSSLFGATGSANFLSRATAALATLFFITSLALAYLATNKPKAGGGVLDAVKTLPDASTKAPAMETKKDEAPKTAPAESSAPGSKPKDVPQ